jgi:pilus assembly protein CpaF
LVKLDVIVESETGEPITRLSATAPLTIGRDAGVGLRLAGRNVSRRHATIQVQSGSLRVLDQSTNGTMVGGRKLHQAGASVPFGTPLAVGEFVIVVRIAGSGGRGGTPAPSASAQVAEEVSDPALRRWLHRQLIENLDLAALEAKDLEDPALRPRVLAALRRIIDERDRGLTGPARERLMAELADEALGLGPLERFLGDPAVTEIMVVDPATIYVERAGRITKTSARFTDEERVRAVIERIVAPLGRRVDDASPLVDARLPDGARVNVVIRPLALRGSCVTIRRFPQRPLSLDRLYELGALSPRMGRFLTRSVVARKNVVVSGGTSSGKTTLLNALSAAIPSRERIITIEDAAELQLAQPHVVGLETRPANLEGQGALCVRDLVRNAMRMRPDRIVVGECRGGEALDMLQAMNTGHDGSLTTIHASSPTEALSRLETLALMGDVGLPLRAIREQIAASVDLVVQTRRYPDGQRRVTAISEVVGIGAATAIELRPIYAYAPGGGRAGALVSGGFHATGYVPSYMEEFGALGLLEPGESYL